HRTDALELSYALVPRADLPDHAGVGTGEVASRDPARRARANHAHVRGLDQRFEPPALDAGELHVERPALRPYVVVLEADVAEVGGGGLQDVLRAGRQMDALARDIHHAALAHRAMRRFHTLDRERHGEQLLYVVFGQVSHHEDPRCKEVTRRSFRVTG